MSIQNGEDYHRSVYSGMERKNSYPARDCGYSQGKLRGEIPEQTLKKQNKRGGALKGFPGKGSIIGMMWGHEEV